MTRTFNNTVSQLWLALLLPSSLVQAGSSVFLAEQVFYERATYLLPIGLLLISVIILLISSIRRIRTHDQELRESEQRYRTFFENSPISLWEEDFSEVKTYLDILKESGVADLRSHLEQHTETVFFCSTLVKVVAVNNATLTLYKAKNKEAFIHGLASVFGEEWHEVFVNELLAIADGKTSFQSEDINQTLEGERIHIFLKWSVAPGHEERYSKVLVSIIDITELKKAEEQIHLLAHAMESSTDLISMTDPHAHFVFFNKAFLSAHGYKESELLGKRPEILLSNNNPTELYREMLRQTLLGGWHGELLSRRKDGSEFPISVVTSPVKNEAGETVALMSIGRDVTERKQTEKLRAALYGIAQAGKFSLHLNDLFREVHATMKSIMPAENFYIAIYDEKKDLLTFPYFADPLIGPVKSRKPGRGLTEYVLRKGKSLLCTPEVHRQLRKTGEAHHLGVPPLTWLGAPLVVEGKAIGVMAVQHHSDPMAYGEGEKQILEFVSTEVAKAIHQKRTEEARLLLASIVESADDAIISKTLDGNILSWNRGAERLYGYSSEEAMDRYLSFIVPEDRAEEIPMMLDKIREGQLIERFETKRLRKDGTLIDVSLTISPLRDSTGMIIGASTIARDITSNKLAEKALRESRERYRNLVENISEVYFVSDNKGHIVYGSPNFFFETGYLPHELLGQSYLRLIVPEDRKRVLNFYQERTFDGTIDTICEFRGRHKDGHFTWVEQSTRIIRDPDGNVKEYRNVVRDITKRKHAEDELIARETRFRALIEQSSDAIVLIRRDGSIDYAGPSIAKIVGYTVEDLIGKNAIDFTYASDLYRLPPMDFMNQPARIATAQLRIQHKNGSWIWIEGVAKNLLGDPAVNAIVVNFRDISERKMAEKMLRTLPKRIIEAQEAERLRVARELHDSVNQILSSAKFRMDSVEDKITHNKPDAKKDAVSAKLALEKAMEEVQRISRNLRPSELDDLGVESAVRSMCEEFQERTQIPVHLAFSDFPGSLTPEIELTMYRIIQEALTNVEKHSKATRMDIECRGDNSSITIFIKDNGIGANIHYLETSPTRSTGGMGLLNVRERAAYVGGTASISAAPKKGMEISVRLPLGKGSPKEDDD